MPDEPSANGLFLVPENSYDTTFGEDNRLPNLPLPLLTETLTKYLASVKPFVNEEEFERTRGIVEKFKNKEGKALDLKLREKARRERNWVEKWWLEWAYLRIRAPLIPYGSMDGAFPYEIPGWRYEGQEDQITHAATVIYCVIEFWKLLRSEKIKPGRSNDKTPFSMVQYRNLFNTVRVPGEEVDELVSYFKTEKEGDCPTNIVVICRGRLFQFSIVDDLGDLLTPPEIGTILKRILVECEGKPAQFPVPSLTCDERTNWSKNYQKLKSLSARNAENLKTIEGSVYVLSLDDNMPETDSQTSNSSLCSNYNNRWADKASATIVFRNGRLSGVCDHTAFDGLVSISLFHYVYLKICESRGGWNGRMYVRPQVTSFQEIVFDLSEDLKSEIQRFAAGSVKNKQDVIMTRVHFENLGKDAIKVTKLHPDSFIQMALQLTYVRLHRRPAPCYETATTRSYYNGRTETVRSCTVECLEWVSAMLDRRISNSTKKELLTRAVEKHNRLMSEGRNNAGCDRHLFGLYCTALEEGLPIPEIYSDPAYTKSGGGGNFVLSTSLVGYSPIGGGVAPMCLDGYGVFYNIQPHKLSATITTNSNSRETDAEKFDNGLRQSLLEMLALWGHNVKSSSKL